MLLTPLGKIDIRVDRQSIDYVYKEIACDAFCKDLSGRFMVRIPFTPDGEKHFISCEIEGYVPSDNDGIESGENLELKSFYKGEIKLSIGMEGETGYLFDGTRISEYDYDNGYLENGVQYKVLPNTKTSEYVFGIAWIEHFDSKTEVQTWFGADPTLF